PTDVGNADAQLGLAQANHVVVIATDQARRLPGGDHFETGHLRDLLRQKRLLDLARPLQILLLQLASCDFPFHRVLELAIAPLEPFARLSEKIITNTADEYVEGRNIPSRRTLTS